MTRKGYYHDNVELTGTKEQKGRVRSEINNQNRTKLIIKRASIGINRTHCDRFYLSRGRLFRVVEIERTSLIERRQ